MIHQWSMSGLRTDIWNRLKRDTEHEFIDLSYTESDPIELADFIEDYACGAMMDSDIVVVLPDSDMEDILDYQGASLSPLRASSYRRQMGFPPDKIYPQELQALLYDSCNTKPALVLGWTKKSAERLAGFLKEHKDVPNYNPGRFYTMGIKDEINKGESIAKRLVSIVNSSTAHFVT